MAKTDRAPQHHNGGNGFYGWGYPYIDPTREADKQTGVIDDPQVVFPGMHGSWMPLSLRSNRGDGYTSLLVEACDAIALPRGFVDKLGDVCLWLSGWSTHFALASWLVPSVPWWGIYVATGLPLVCFCLVLIAVCIHRPVMIPFGVLRSVLIVIAWTLVT